MKDRLTNIDLLKVICIFSVILLHVSSHQAFDITYNYIYNKNFSILNFYNMITRFCVPGFIIISGMFLLDKDISLKTIFRKYVLRMVILYIVFSLIYTTLFYCKNHSINLINTFFMGYYHLWYIYVIIGLYLVTPFLRIIVKNKQLTIYFIILCFVFSSVIPFFIELFNIEILRNITLNLNLHIPMGYVGYYVLGYYISKSNVNKYLVYILGILGLVCNYIVFSTIGYQMNMYDMVFRFPTTYLYTISIFVIFKNIKIKNNKIIKYLASLTTGIYLVHLIILELLFNIYPFFIYDNCILNPVLLSLCIYVICVFITVFLKSIPFIKKII